MFPGIKEVAELGKYFEVRVEDEDTVFLKCNRISYPDRDVTNIAKLIGELAPDESDIVEDQEVRLWWD